MPAPDRGVRAQVARFLAVGGVTAALDFGVYRILLLLDVSITPAKACGFVIGTGVSYLLNRAWTFGAQGHAPIRFLLLYTVTLVVNVVVNAAAVAGLDGVAGRITLAWLVAQAVASAMNFIGMQRYVFARRTPAGVAPAEGTGSADG